MPHREELVYTRSEDDHVELDGALFRPATDPVRPVGLVWTPGAGVSFSINEQVTQICRALASQGFLVLNGNNRGHDFGAYNQRDDGYRQLGGIAWERFEECPRDISAWITVATERYGIRGVALLGHSLGAFKVGYYQAQRQDPYVLGLIVASPCRDVGNSLTPERAALAERMVAEGRGEEWATGAVVGAEEEDAPVAARRSAQFYVSAAHAGGLDVYGLRGASDSAVSRIRCPILAFYGAEEELCGTAHDLETLRVNARSVMRVETALVGGDHTYTGHRDEVVALLTHWLGELEMEATSAL